MAGQQGVGQRAQPDQAAAHRPARQEERRDAARHDDVGHRRAAAVQEGGCFGHCRNIGTACRAGYRPAQHGYQLRAMTRGDAAAVAALIRAAFAAQSVVTDPLPSALRVTDGRRRGAPGSRRRRGGRGVAALSSGRRCGWSRTAGCICRAWRWRWLARPRHRQGAGRGGRSGGARRLGLPRVHLSTRLVLIDNRRLFAACGFVETTREAHPGYAEPTFVDMEKRLADG